MKNKLTFIFIALSFYMNAQIYTPDGTIQGQSISNNVGIGTSNTTAKLTIQAGPNGYPTPLKAISIWGPNSPENANSAQDLSWDFAGAGSAVIRSFRGGYYDTYMQFMTNSHSSAKNAPQVRMHISENGNVGIGTITPNARLDLGNGYGTSGAKFLIYNDNPASELSGTKCGFYMDNFTSNNLNLVFPEENTVPGLFTISAKNTTGVNLKPYFSIAGISGNVGIGTTTPDSKLAVNGTIHSKEVKVDLNGWPDYVFKREYSLPTLEEVEKHIAEKGHLEIFQAKRKF